VVSLRALIGNCGAGGGGVDIAVAAKALKEQKAPAIVNRDTPLDGIGTNAPAKDTAMNHVLVFNMGLGGQNTAMVLKKLEA